MRISVSVEALSSDRSSQVLGGNKTSYYVGEKKPTMNVRQRSKR